MVESRNNGVPLVIQAPKAKLTKSIQQLADSLGQSPTGEQPDEEAQEKPKKKGLFSFLSSGSR